MQNKDAIITELVKTNVNIVSVPDLQKKQLTGEKTSHIVGLLVKRQNQNVEKTTDKDTKEKAKDTTENQPKKGHFTSCVWR